MRAEDDRRPRAVCAAPGAFFFAMLLGLSATSCLKLDVDANLAQDGSVQLVGTYSISNLVLPLFSDPSLSPVPALPVNRQGWASLSAMVPGTVLNSFSSANGPESVDYKLSLSFPSLSVFMDFLNQMSLKASYSNSAFTRKLVIDMYPIDRKQDPQFISSLAVLYDSWKISCRFNFPSPVVQTENGERQGKTASYAVSVSDIVSSAKNTVWSISW
jgi:hypothetical protein